jgi:hypothetical protein
MRQSEVRGISHITRVLRSYYDPVKHTLIETRQIILCMVGVTSAQVAPNPI